MLWSVKRSWSCLLFPPALPPHMAGTDDISPLPYVCVSYIYLSLIRAMLTMPVVDSDRLAFFTVVVFAVFADIFGFHTVRAFVVSHGCVYGFKPIEESEDSAMSVFFLCFSVCVSFFCVFLF